MAMTLSSTAATLSTSRVVAQAGSPKHHTLNQPRVNFPWKTDYRGGGIHVRVMSTPSQISEKVTESIKNAEEVCKSDPNTGECAAAWDEVEEVSAAASHARLKEKEENADPLEKFCKDNMDTEECRTYDD